MIFSSARIESLLDKLVSSNRKETEGYWRDVIAEEIKDYREDLMADIEYDYGQGSEYEACDSVLGLVEYVVRNKKLPPLGEL
jgi:hypothetical protein